MFDLAARAVEAGYDLRLRDPRAVAAVTATCWSSTSIPRASPIPRLRRGRTRAAPGARRTVLGRRPDARVRRADEGGVRDPRLDAAALSPRDGAAALDSPAQAGAAHRPDSGAREAGRRAGARSRRSSAVRPTSSPGRLPRPAPKPWSDEAAARSRDGRARSKPSGRPRPDRPRRRRPSRLTDARPQPSAADARTAAGLQGSVPRRDAARRRSSSTAPSSRRRSGSTSSGDRVVFVVRAAASRAAHAARAEPARGSRRWRRELAGRRMTVVVAPRAPAAADAHVAASPARPAPPQPDRQAVLKQQALADSGVQAMLDVFRGRDQGCGGDVVVAAGSRA